MFSSLEATRLVSVSKTVGETAQAVINSRCVNHHNIKTQQNNWDVLVTHSSSHETKFFTMPFRCHQQGSFWASSKPCQCTLVNPAGTGTTPPAISRRCLCHHQTPHWKRALHQLDLRCGAILQPFQLFQYCLYQLLLVSLVPLQRCKQVVLLLVSIIQPEWDKGGNIKVTDCNAKQIWFLFHSPRN